MTNTQQLSTVRIVKQWDGAPATTTIFVDQNGRRPFEASTVATEKAPALLRLPALDSDLRR